MRWPTLRFDLRFQIAALGVGGVLTLGVVSFVAAHTQARYQQLADASLHLQERLAAVEGPVASLPADDPLREAEVIRAGLNIDAIRFQNVAAAQRTLGFTERDGLQNGLRTAASLSWWVGQRTSGSLRTMARAMERLAGGDLSVSGPCLERRDEIGAISRAFAIFQSEKAENDDLTRAQAAARTRGEAGRKAALLGLADGFERAVSGIDGVASAIASAVEEQGVVTREIVRNVTQAARGTGAVTGTIAGVARAAEETGAAAGEVLSAASGLSRLSEHLAGEVESSFATVRAA